MYHFINGELFPANEAKIFIHDLAILRGYGIFDYLRTYNRKPFLLDSYLSRFMNSAKIAGLQVPNNKAEITSIMEKLISLSKFEECGIRLVLTGGYSFDYYTLVKPNFFILLENFSVPHENDFLNGIKIISYEYMREFPEAKLINYAPSIIFNNQNAEKKASEILFHFHGKITEASRSNFFVIQGDRLITAGKNVLKGITRDTVLKLAKKDFFIEELNFSINKLNSVDEAFLTSTTKGIMPVVQIDDHILGQGTIGQGTAHLMELYMNYVNDFKNL